MDSIAIIVRDTSILNPNAFSRSREAVEALGVETKSAKHAFGRGDHGQRSIQDFRPDAIAG
jgi:hypothetical protein